MGPFIFGVGGFTYRAQRGLDVQQIALEENKDMSTFDNVLICINKVL